MKQQVSKRSTKPKSQAQKPAKAAAKSSPLPIQSGFRPESALKSLQGGSVPQHLVPYLSHLLAPAVNAPVRPPDPKYGRVRTATVTSMRLVDVVANFDGSEDSGRFACCVQPGLGSISAPSKYKVALVDSSNGWVDQSDFNDPSSFLAHAGVGGSNDLRLDPNYSDMTQPPPGHAVRETFSNGVQTYGPLGPDTVQLPLSDIAYNLDVEVEQPVDGTSRLLLPSGVFVITATLSEDAGSFTQAPLVSSSNVTLAIGSADIWVGLPYSVWTFVAYASVDLELDGDAYIDFAFRAPDQWNDGTAIFTVTPAGIDLTATTPVLPDQPDSGMIQQVRPIAMSVLYSSVLAPINDGGEVVIALVPGHTCESLFFSVNPSNNPGPLALYENLGSIEGSSAVPHVDGGYCYWAPNNMDDWRFMQPSDMEEYQYPCIILSGRVMSPLTGIQTVGRMIIHSSYEILTVKNYLPLECSIGSQADIDAIFSFLAREPRAMANDEHISWLRSVMQRLGRGVQAVATFYRQNQSWLTPAAKAALAALM